MARILLVDDDAELLDAVSMAFEDAGHSVQTAADGLRAQALLRRDGADVMVCDVNMPGLDGFSLCRRLREAGETIPIILLTSRDDEVDEALGLELGADDYMAKPFSSRVLLARVAALIRRDQLRHQDVPEPDVLRRNGVTLLPERLEVRLGDVPIAVTVTEFKLLEVLMRRPGIVLSRDRLLDLIRGDDSVVAQRIIDTYIRRLRRKFEQLDPDFAAIETVIGAGYRWAHDDA